MIFTDVVIHDCKTKSHKTLQEKQGLLRTAEAMRLGIHPRTLYQMRDEGLLEQLVKEFIG